MPESRWLSTGVMALLTVFLGGCSGEGPVSEHVVLRDGLHRLQSDFNDGVGKVRAIFLASPT